MEQFLHHMVKENTPNLFSISQGRVSNPPGAEGVKACAEGSLPSTQPSDGLHSEVHTVPSPLGTHASSVGNLVTSAKSFAGNPIAFVDDVARTAATDTTTAVKSLAGTGFAVEKTIHTTEPSATNPVAVVSSMASATAINATVATKSVASTGLTIEQTVVSAAVTGTTTAAGAVTSTGLTVKQTVHAIESSAANSITLVGNVARDAATGATDAIKDRALALVLARLRAIVFFYAAKFPIVGVYFKRRSGPDVEILVAETTPLLGGFHGSGAFATGQPKGLLWRLLFTLLRLLPCGSLCKISAGCYVLARDGSGWLFINLQEHSLVVAPTISLGHLSTTDLAASTIGTAVASVTGYSIIQGFVSSLDKALEGTPNRHVAMIACARVAVVTGIVLVPITNLWVVQSATLLRGLGQPPEISGPASEFLQIAAAGLPGYAIGEIAKQYLASQGLSHVHVRVLSVIAPLNLVLNYLLVVGPIPALRFGFAGAPLCTVLSYNALAVLLIIYIVRRARRGQVEHVRGQDAVSAGGDHSEVTFFAGLDALIFAGLSGVLKNASQIWSKDFGGVVAGILGPNALATQAVVLTTATTLYQAPKAVNNSSSERTKEWVAKGKVRRAKIAVSAAFVATLGGTVMISGVLLAFATSWGTLFNSDPVIVQSVSTLLPVIAVFHAVQGFGVWVDGALGALGNTAVFPSLNASADYFLGIPLGAYLALSRHWGLAGLWVGLTVSLTFCCLAATIVLVKTNWKNAVDAKGEDGSRREQQEVHPSMESRVFSAFV